MGRTCTRESERPGPNPAPTPPAQGPACGCVLGPSGSRPAPIPASVLPLYCRPLTRPVGRVLRFGGSSQGANPRVGRAPGAWRPWPPKQPHPGQTPGPRLRSRAPTGHRKAAHAPGARSTLTVQPRSRPDPLSGAPSPRGPGSCISGSPTDLVGKQEVAHGGVTWVFHDGTDHLQHRGDAYKAAPPPLSERLLYA